MAEEAAEKVIGSAMPRPYLYGAPVWIVMSGKKYREGDPCAPLHIESMDANMAQRINENLFWMIGSIIENMCLAATNRGLANCAINTTVVSLLGNMLEPGENRHFEPGEFSQFWPKKNSQQSSAIVNYLNLWAIFVPSEYYNVGFSVRRVTLSSLCPR